MVNSTENTPAHCHGCRKFDFCRQAQNMMADTPPQQGWVRNGDVYCAGCLDPDYDDRCVGNGPYSGDSDTPQHCGGCGVPIIHKMTAEGVEYVRNNSVGCCREVWPTVWGIVPMIPVNSIVIPKRFKTVCDDWHGGQSCMLYAVSSGKNLTTGTHPPWGCSSDKQWYLSIWRDLANDADHTYSQAQRPGCAYPDDLIELGEFVDWVDYQVARLERSYGLADWDACDD